MAVLKINNRDLRRLWLSFCGLGTAPTGALDLPQMIDDLGFVQLDTIQVISRAHHHILWSRNQNYREPMLDKMLAEDRGLFEHYTHDASVLPMAYLPYWQRQFVRRAEQIGRAGYYRNMLDEAGREAIKQRIAVEGPLSTHAFDTKAKRKAMWSRPPHKMALDYMWYTGELATSHRINFKKYYDLAENVFPAELRAMNISDADQIDWLCHGALRRLGVATIGEIQKFWEAMDTREARQWVEQNSEHLLPVQVQAFDGSWSDSFAQIDIETTLQNTKPTTSRLRILSPFDPAIRDRTRLNRLFGFEYRIEIFVPAAKRKYGYYVFPLLEGDRFVGRIEVKADRAKGLLNVLNLWPEKGVKWTDQRSAKLDGELTRMARLVGVTDVVWQPKT